MSLDQQDTPSPLHQEKTRKQRLLTVLKAKVVLLREQLEAAENECKILEAELARNLSPVTYPRASIHDLPTETLIEIFALSILEWHEDIGKLLFVCKQWNAIVMNSPDLWNTISQVFILDKETLGQWLAYCTNCIERSGDKLLTVSIHDTNLYEGLQYLNPSIEEETECIESLWTSLKIHDNECVKRYKSFRINLPPCSTTDKILSHLFTCHFPNLTCLSLPNFGQNDAFSQFLIKNPLPILTIGDGRRPVIHKLGSSIKALKALDCHVSQVLYRIPSISSLESLTLRRDSPHATVGNLNRLPRLRTLNLVGLWSDYALSMLEVPALSRITFDNVNFSRKLKAKPSELYWELASRTRSPTIDNNFVSNISQLLHHYDSVKTMKVPLCASNFVLGAFEKLAHQEVVSVEILGMRVLDDDSVLLEIDISTEPS